MQEENLQNLSEVEDQAISSRLAKLRTMPMDTSRLESALRAKLPQPRRPWRILSLRPLQTIAASFLLVVAIFAAVVLSTSGGPVLASAAQMAQMHDDIVSGRTPVMQVSSVVEANRMLDRQSPGAPALPQMPDHAMACCMKSVHDKKVACILLKDDQVPITMAVASAADMKLPAAPVVSRNGIEYRVQSANGLAMVMTEQNGKWLCLIGRCSADRLMDVAAQMRF
jgi:hypothetical protein